MSTEQQLIERTARAIARDNAAREAYDKARIEADEASKDLREAWSALRNHQDQQVVRALKLVA